MADLNALIAQGAQFRQPTDPFAQYGQLQQLQQSQQAGQMNQMKLQEMQRGIAEQEGMRNYLRQTPNFDPLNPGHQSGLMQVAPTTAPKLLEAFLTAKKTGSEINAAGIKAAADKKAMLAQAARDIASRPDDENIISHVRDVKESPLFTPEEKAQVQAKASSWLALPIAQRPAAIGNPGATAGDISTAATAGLNRAQTAATALAGQKVTERGQNITAQTAKRGQDITAQTAATALAQAGNLPLQEGLAAARERGTLTTKNEITAKAILPKVIADAEVGLAAIDSMIGSAQVDKKSGRITLAQGGAGVHPGFGQAVGAGIPGLKYVPGSREADFDALYKQVMGGAFLDAYESLRGANAITDIEGAKGTAAKTRLSTAQSEPEFIQAARELQSIMRKGVERAKGKAGTMSNSNPHAAKTDAEIKAELGL